MHRYRCGHSCVIYKFHICVWAFPFADHCIRLCPSAAHRRRTISASCSRRLSSSGSPEPDTGSTRRNPTSSWRPSVPSCLHETFNGPLGPPTTLRNLGQSLPISSPSAPVPGVQGGSWRYSPSSPHSGNTRMVPASSGFPERVRESSCPECALSDSLWHASGRVRFPVNLWSHKAVFHWLCVFDGVGVDLALFQAIPLWAKSGAAALSAMFASYRKIILARTADRPTVACNVLISLWRVERWPWIGQWTYGGDTAWLSAAGL